MIQRRRKNILSIYNAPEGIAKEKGRKTVSRAGARRLRLLSSPDMLPLVRHLRTPIILTFPLVRKMQRNAGEKEKTKPPVEQQTVAEKRNKNMKPSILGYLVKTYNCVKTSWENHGHRRKSASAKERNERERNLFNHLHVLHVKLPLDTRPIRRPIRWIICPFDSIESTQQLRYGAPQQLQHQRARTEQLHQNQARTAAPVWGATAAPASPSAHTDPPKHFGAPTTYLQSATSRGPQPHSGSPRSSPGLFVRRVAESFFLL